jgi:hypothetical protein
MSTDAGSKLLLVVAATAAALGKPPPPVETLSGTFLPTFPDCAVTMVLPSATAVAVVVRPVVGFRLTTPGFDDDHVTEAVGIACPF